MKPSWDLDELLQKTLDINWEVSRRNGRIMRRSAWYTVSGCSCQYAYGQGQPWPANDMDDWMLQLCHDVAKLCCLKNVPNSANFNEYSSRSQMLPFHADDEALFPDEDGETEIVSLSLGSMREFKIRRYYDDDDNCWTTPSRHGDVLIMRRRMQHCFQHSVAQGTSDSGNRSNMTLWYLRNHTKKCKYKNDG